MVSAEETYVIGAIRKIAVKNSRCQGKHSVLGVSPSNSIQYLQNAGVVDGVLFRSPKENEIRQETIIC